MRFLIVTKAKLPGPPPEVMLGLFDAMAPWQKKWAKKIELIWGFAGIAGGGGIANVASLEELDAFMAELPVGAISDVEIYGLVDVEGSLQRAKQAIQAMAPKGGR